MKDNKLTYFGNLEKSEILSSVNIPADSDNLIFESRSSFFGYYDDLPGVHNDNTYLYLVVDKNHTFIEVHRAVLAVRTDLCCDVDVEYATLYVSHQEYIAVRVRYLKDLSQLPDIQRSLTANGIRFLQGGGKANQTSATKITKYFSLEVKGEGLWLDTIAHNHGYIQLPHRLDLSEFKALVQKVRNNWQGLSFDAGLAALSSPDEVIEAVRIYSKHVDDAGYLEDLQKAFKSAL